MSVGFGCATTMLYPESMSADPQAVAVLVDLTLKNGY